MASSLRVCVNSQTPYVRFKLGYFELLEKYGKLEEPVDLGRLELGVDYEITPGGVTAMVFPLLNKMVGAGLIQSPSWVSLGPNAPYMVKAGNLILYNISLDDRDIPLYTSFKEGIWRELHLQGFMEIRAEEYEAYTRYNWLCAQTLFQLLPQTDLYSVHDFQQLQVGNLIGPSAPAILRWHIPFRLEAVSPKIRAFILKNISSFDAVIVSTRRDLEGLVHAGYHGKAYQVYPYTDFSKWKKPARSEAEAFKSKFNIKSSDRVLAVVARMDEAKSQDLAIAAVASVRKRYPRVKLLLIGDGSFTSSGKGGLSHPKGELWKDRLIALSRELRVEDMVTLTGYLPEEDVRSAYSIVEAVLVPSRVEGFNLTTVESWLYRKPVVVSKGAGSSELVIEDMNGYVFNPSKPSELAEKIDRVLRRPEAAAKMGEQGYYSAKQCDINKATKTVATIFEETVNLFR